MTTMEADTDPETIDIGSGSLGVIAVRQEMPLGKSGFEPEGTNGVFVGMRKTSEELALPGFQESICAGMEWRKQRIWRNSFPVEVRLDLMVSISWFLIRVLV
jgi:hypothetical protein